MPCTTAVPSGPSRSSTKAIGRRSPSRSAPPSPTPVSFGLDELVRLYGRPARVRVDNGPELVAEAFVEWCTAQRISLGYIPPGKPDQNAFIERFNRTYREEDARRPSLRVARAGARDH